MSRNRTPLGLWIIAGLLTAAGLNALMQVFNEIREPESGSRILGALQLATASSAILAAIAVVRLDARAPAVILTWGAISAVMVVLLEPLGFVQAIDRAGLWQGAAVILVGSLAMYWYVRRSIGVVRAAEQPKR